MKRPHVFSPCLLAVAKGLANKILYEKEGKIVSDLASQKNEEVTDVDFRIELNGIKSELVIVIDSESNEKE